MGGVRWGMNYTVTQTKYVQSLDDLRRLIEKHSAWKMSFWEFQQKVCEYEEGGVQYKGQLSWGASGTDVQQMFTLAQYIHKHYLPR